MWVHRVLGLLRDQKNFLNLFIVKWRRTLSYSVKRLLVLISFFFFFFFALHCDVCEWSNTKKAWDSLGRFMPFRVKYCPRAGDTVAGRIKPLPWGPYTDNINQRGAHHTPGVLCCKSLQFSSVQFSHSVVSDSLLNSQQKELCIHTFPVWKKANPRNGKSHSKMENIWVLKGSI